MTMARYAVASRRRTRGSAVAGPTIAGGLLGGIAVAIVMALHPVHGNAVAETGGSTKNPTSVVHTVAPSPAQATGGSQDSSANTGGSHTEIVAAPASGGGGSQPSGSGSSAEPPSIAERPVGPPDVANIAPDCPARPDCTPGVPDSLPAGEQNPGISAHTTSPPQPPDPQPSDPQPREPSAPSSSAPSAPSS